LTIVVLLLIPVVIVIVLISGVVLMISGAGMFCDYLYWQAKTKKDDTF
jgi:hypothetical protein